jgi:predicted acyltransferase
VFTLFPWVALVPVGAFVGLLLTGERDEAAEIRLHRRLAMAGAAIAAVGFALGAIGNPAIAFWTSRWSVFLAQVGLMTVAIWAAWAWMPTRAAAHLGGTPMVLFGRTSLFVYWVHVELAYGMLSYPLHKSLPLAWAMVGLAAMFLLMYWAATWWTQRQSRVQSPGSRVPVPDAGR